MKSAGATTGRLRNAVRRRNASRWSGGRPWAKASVSGCAERIDRRHLQVEFTANDALPPGWELEVRVTFPHGLINVPTPNWRQGTTWRQVAIEHAAPWVFAPGFYRSLAVAGILLAVFLWFWARHRRKWDPHRRGAATRPPSDLPAPVISILKPLPATPRTMLAMLVEMCQQGRLQIEGVNAPWRSETT